MKCWRSRLVVNVLILLAITLATVVRCQDEQQASTDVADGGTAAGAEDVKVRERNACTEKKASLCNLCRLIKC